MYELFDPCTVMFFFRNKARARPACAALANGRKRVQRRCRARRAALTAAPRGRAAHHDRPGHGQQQQDQLGVQREAGDDRHNRNRVPRGAQGPRPGGVAQGLQHQVPVLSAGGNGRGSGRCCCGRLRQRHARRAVAVSYSFTAGSCCLCFGLRHARPCVVASGAADITDEVPTSEVIRCLASSRVLLGQTCAACICAAASGTDHVCHGTGDARRGDARAPSAAPRRRSGVAAPSASPSRRARMLRE